MAHSTTGREELRILVVEDDALLGSELAMTLQEAGYATLGPVRTLLDARKLLAKERVDGAVLDLNLGPEGARDGAVLADLLCDMNVPFLFLTGHPREAIDSHLRAFPHVSKPVAARVLLAQLAASLERDEP